MKWRKFKAKHPEIGTNIFVSDGNHLALIEFTLPVKRYIESSMNEYFECDYIFDDPSYDAEYCLSPLYMWCYPSSILPKVNRNESS